MVLPVNDEGLFLEQFSVSARSNKITVVAKKDGKSKTLIRSFRLN
jgi:hypothetical protein